MDGSIQTKNAMPAAGLHKDNPSILKDGEMDPLRTNRRGELRVTLEDEVRGLRLVMEEMVRQQRETNALLERIR